MSSLTLAKRLIAEYSTTICISESNNTNISHLCEFITKSKGDFFSSKLVLNACFIRFLVYKNIFYTECKFTIKNK